MSRLFPAVSPEDAWCPSCDGDGHTENPDDQPTECPTCHGKGFPPVMRTEDWDDEPGFPIRALEI